MVGYDHYQGHTDLINADRLREECGLFGIYNHQDAAAITALGLHALQHRGQEAGGIVSYDNTNANRGFRSERRLGLISDHFTKRSTIEGLPGRQAVGHVRYSTSGGSALRNIQPLFAELDVGGIAIAHNGNFTNAVSLRQELIHQGTIFQSTSDTETVLHLIARSREPRLVKRFIEAYSAMEGGFALVAMTGKKLMGARDPHGIRPLILGDLNGSPVLTSETCALDIIGAKFVRSVENGELIVCTHDGVESIRIAPKISERLCIFEYIYFSRPDSIVSGRSVYQVRKNMGQELANESNVHGDIVIPVPDSGVPAAIGFAQATSLPFELGIIRNHYVGRTFIEPMQSIRAFGVKLKHNATRAVINGKRIILVDDSIVRGTTSSKIVRMVREAGAKRVDLLVSCPPIAYPDYYGIDTPDRTALLAANHSIEEMRQIIGADSLQFLSIEGVYRAIGIGARDPQRPQFSDHCFTGDYPTPLSDLSRSNPKMAEELGQNMPALDNYHSKVI